MIWADQQTPTHLRDIVRSAISFASSQLRVLPKILSFGRAGADLVSIKNRDNALYHFTSLSDMDGWERISILRQ
jgi:hypothetical protein